MNMHRRSDGWNKSKGQINKDDPQDSNPLSAVFKESCLTEWATQMCVQQTALERLTYEMSWQKSYLAQWVNFLRNLWLTGQLKSHIKKYCNWLASNLLEC